MGKTKNQRTATTTSAATSHEDQEPENSPATADEAVDVKTATHAPRVKAKIENHAKYHGSRAYNVKAYDGLVGHPKLSRVVSFLLFAAYAMFAMAMIVTTMMTTPITGTFVMEVMGIPEDGSLLTLMAFWLLPSIFLMVVIAIAECKLIGVIWRRMISPMLARLYDVRQQTSV